MHLSLFKRFCINLIVIHQCQLLMQALQVAAGGMHTAALADDGTVWSWGVNDEGALGRQTAGELWDKASERVGRRRRAAYNVALLCIPSKLVISAFLRCSRHNTSLPCDRGSAEERQGWRPLPARTCDHAARGKGGAAVGRLVLTASDPRSDAVMKNQYYACCLEVAANTV